MTVKMTDADVKRGIEAHPGWTEVTGELQRTYSFADFREAMAFVLQVAEYAERVQHHPNILIRYNRVTLTVNTHDVGGITSKDFALAAECDTMAERG